MRLVGTFLDALGSFFVVITLMVDDLAADFLEALEG